MFGKKLLYPLLIFIFIATDLFANDFMFSNATMGIVSIVFFAWLILGWAIRRKYKELMFLGNGAIIITIIFPVTLCGHIEFALIFWMIYLTILSVYYASPREKISSKERKINLIFHGSFLAVVIIGGIIGKYIYYSRMGGYALWANRMRKYYPDFIIVMCVFFAFEFTYLLYKKEINKKKIKHETNI